MRRLTATFSDPANAALARASLVRAGIPVDRVVLSLTLTADDIAAEAPGQSYENQGYASSDQVKAGRGYTDTDRARYNEEVRTAACILTVELDASAKHEAIAGVLREHGARSVIEAAP
jgi:hypothetical protein